MKPSGGKVRIGVIAALGAAAFAIVAVATLTVSHAQLATSVWPMFHHDVRHTGLSTVDTSANPGEQKWACLLKTPNACDIRALEKLEGIFSWSAGGIRRLNRDTLECKPSGTC